MIPRRSVMLAIAMLLATGSFTWAGEISSTYSKLDFEKGCRWEEPANEEEASMGGSAVCDGLPGYPVHFAESDLRQIVSYGDADDPYAHTSGFAQWNAVNDVIEWRLLDGKPFATIHRWFIDNIDPNTGSAEPSMRGEVLVISTVADRTDRAGASSSCAVGFVDARANRDANLLAREVADKMARSFKCGVYKPAFHGERGQTSGTPWALVD